MNKRNDQDELRQSDWWCSESERDAAEVHIYGPDGDLIVTTQGNLALGWSAWEVAQDILDARVGRASRVD